MTIARRIKLCKYIDKIESNKKAAKDVGVRNASILKGKKVHQEK